MYAAVETLMIGIVRLSGSVRWLDHGKFLAAIEPAEFLFGEDVTIYLREMQTLVNTLSEKQKEDVTQNTYGEDVFAASADRKAILDGLGALNKRRNEIFRPYLLIHEE